MTLRRFSALLAGLAALSWAIVPPALAQSHTGLRIALRIVADCSAATPSSGDRHCPPAQQRSDAPTPVPPQVQALTPAEPAEAHAQDRVTVTY